MTGARFAGFLASLAVALLLQYMVLPDSLAALRPLWLPLVLGYWALFAPEYPALITSWLLGLGCDVVYDAPFGQYALGLLTVTFVIRSMRNMLIVFPTWQSTLVLAPAWCLFSLMMSWIDGTVHHRAVSALRWIPVATTTFAWPLVVTVLNNLRQRGDRHARLP
jgi:rod shape-determining protein MreD